MKNNDQEQGKKYLRRKDLAIRYSVSTQHIYNLIKSGELPPPMVLHGAKVWPIELIESIDAERNVAYIQTLSRKWKSL